MDIDQWKSGLRTETEKCSPPFFYTGEQSEHSSREQKPVPGKRTHLLSTLLQGTDQIEFRFKRTPEQESVQGTKKSSM